MPFPGLAPDFLGNRPMTATRWPIPDSCEAYTLQRQPRAGFHHFAATGFSLVEPLYYINILARRFSAITLTANGLSPWGSNPADRTEADAEVRSTCISIVKEKPFGHL